MRLGSFEERAEVGVIAGELRLREGVPGPAEERRTAQADGIANDGDARAAEAGVSAFCSGSPRFIDTDIAGIAAREGNAVAWLRLYRVHGARAPERVQGAFAVAILDIARVEALLAVDRFAIEPLCYWSDGERIAFASRADAVPNVPRELDPQAVYDYLYFHVVPAPRTIFTGIGRLAGGHRAVFTEGRCAVEPWWTPQFRERDTASVPALASEFRTLLRNAVARRLEGATTGCYLSGGTDSSTVTGIIAELTGQPPRAYSIGFDVAGYDEMDYARIAARHFGADHREYYVTPHDLSDHIPAVVAAFDQPFGNSSVLPAFCCARMAHTDGMRTVLAGDGGDELFGGNTRYAKQHVFEHYASVPRGLRRGLVEPAVSALPWLARVPLLRKAASYVEQAQVPMPDRMQRYNLLDRLGPRDIFEPAFLARVDTEAPLQQQRAIYGQTHGESLINRMLEFDWKYTLADADLPKVTGSAHAAGIKVGFPLLDDDLVDFSLRLAPELKLRGQRLRYFFKEALRGFLPEAILAKKKHGFGLPFGNWVLQDRRLCALAFDSLRDFKARGIVRGSFIDALTEKLLPSHPGYYGEMVWILMMLEQWLRLGRHAGMATKPATADLTS